MENYVVNDCGVALLAFLGPHNFAPWYGSLCCGHLGLGAAASAFQPYFGWAEVGRGNDRFLNQSSIVDLI